MEDNTYLAPMTMPGTILGVLLKLSHQYLPQPLKSVNL